MGSVGLMSTAGLANDRQAERPAMLHALLSANECRIGDLIAFSKGIPAEWVAPIAIALSESLKSSRVSRRRIAQRRREMVILAVLVSRITFELEAIPQDPDARI